MARLMSEVFRETASRIENKAQGPLGSFLSLFPKRVKVWGLGSTEASNPKTLYKA